MSQRGKGGERDPVVAEIDGKTVRMSDLDKSVHQEIARIDRDSEKQKYDARKQGLDAMLFRLLVERQAKKEGVDAETYLQREIEQKLLEVTELDARAFFEKNRERVGGAEFDELKPKIVEFLTTQRRSEAVVSMYARLKNEGQAKIYLAAPATERRKVEAVGPSMGDDKAPVVIVTFSDFQCPFCARARATAEKVLVAYPGRVRLIFRQFPLPFHDKAFKAAEASLCAHDQGKFWALHDHMFEHQDALDVEALKQSARSVGLDGGAFDKCLDAGMHAGEVTASIAAGKLLGLEGTPAFFINGIELHGAQPFERFTEIIDAELAPK